MRGRTSYGQEPSLRSVIVSPKGKDGIGMVIEEITLRVRLPNGQRRAIAGRVTKDGATGMFVGRGSNGVYWSSSNAVDVSEKIVSRILYRVLGKNIITEMRRLSTEE